MRFLLLACLPFFVLPGCSDSTPRTVPVSGAVTLDNEPIAEGTIQFMPVGNGTPGMAQIVAGKFQTDLPAGKFNAIVSATKETGKMITGYSEPYPERVSIVPSRYSAGIEIEVAPPATTHDFRLSSE